MFSIEFSTIRRLLTLGTSLVSLAICGCDSSSPSTSLASAGPAEDGGRAGESSTPARITADAGSPSTDATPTEWTGPYPVVIGAGSFAPAFAYAPMASRLREHGFDVHVYVIPTPLRSIAYTAPTFATFVADVLRTTGAPKVSIVAHSQSGLLARYYIRFLGGLPRVDTLVSLSGLHYGSKLANLPIILGVPSCLGVEICQELVPGSALLASLDEPIDVDGDIHFVNITSKFEEAAIPYTNNFHRDLEAGDVTNFAIQDQCPFRFVDHLLLATDGPTAHAIVDGLSRRSVGGMNRDSRAARGRRET